MADTDDVNAFHFQVTHQLSKLVYHPHFQRFQLNNRPCMVKRVAAILHCQQQQYHRITRILLSTNPMKAPTHHIACINNHQYTTVHHHHFLLQFHQHSNRYGFLIRRKLCENEHWTSYNCYIKIEEILLKTHNLHE